jgi:hypothetical protein
MENGTHLLGSAVAAGLGATLIMDLWNLFLKRSFGIASLDLCLLGRWLRHMEQGIFAHANIARAPSKRFECLVGRIAHYGIGAGLALLFLAVVSERWFPSPTLLPALLFGIGTVVLPYFTLQPAFGLGVAASRAPHPAQARVKSFLSHAVFGLGLYLCALFVSYVLRAQSF